MPLLDSTEHPHVATARRRYRRSDSMGGSLDEFADLFVDRKCWKQTLSVEDVEWWQSRRIDVTHKVYFVDNPELDENCTLEIGNDILDVKAVSEESVGFDLLWKVVCQKINTEVQS